MKAINNDLFIHISGAGRGDSRTGDLTPQATTPDTPPPPAVPGEFGLCSPASQQQ